MIGLSSLIGFQLYGKYPERGCVLIISSPTCVTCKTIKRALNAKENEIKPDIYTYDLQSGETHIQLCDNDVEISRLPTVLYVKPNGSKLNITPINITSSIPDMISELNKLWEGSEIKDDT